MITSRILSLAFIAIGLPTACGSIRGSAFYENPNLVKWFSVVVLLFIGFIIGRGTKKSS